MSNQILSYRPKSGHTVTAAALLSMLFAQLAVRLFAVLSGRCHNKACRPLC